MKQRIKDLKLSEVYTTEEALRLLGLPPTHSYFLYREKDKGGLTLTFKRAGRRFWLKKEVTALAGYGTEFDTPDGHTFGELLDLNQVRTLLGKAQGRRSVSKEHVYSLSDLRDGPLETFGSEDLRFWLAKSVNKFIKEGKRQGTYPRRTGRPPKHEQNGAA